MRKFFGFALFLGIFSLAAFAQESGSAPKAEIFGGYQYTRFDGGVNANGWDTALTGNLNRWFGVAADFSGAYKSQNGASFNNYTYTFGPVISYRHNEALLRSRTSWRAASAAQLHLVACPRRITVSP